MDERISISRRVAYVRNPGRVAFINLDRSAEPVQLATDTAAAIWSAVDDAAGGDDATREHLVARLVAEFDAPADIVASGVDAFIDEMLAAGNFTTDEGEEA